MSYREKKREKEDMDHLRSLRELDSRVDDPKKAKVDIERRLVTTKRCYECGQIFLGKGVGHTCKLVPVDASEQVAPAPLQGILDGEGEGAEKKEKALLTCVGGQWVLSKVPLIKTIRGGSVVFTVASNGIEPPQGSALPSNNSVTYRPLSAEAIKICEDMFQMGVAIKKDKRSHKEMFLKVKECVSSLEMPEESQIKKWYQSRCVQSKALTESGKKEGAKKAAAAKESGKKGKKGKKDKNDKKDKKSRVKESKEESDDDESEDGESNSDAYEFDTKDDKYSVGQRVQRYFEETNQYYEGVITKSFGGAYKIEYDDEQIEVCKWADFDTFQGVGFEAIDTIMKKNK